MEYVLSDNVTHREQLNANCCNEKQQFLRINKMCHIYKEAPPILLMFNMLSKLTLLYYYRFTKCISRTSKNIFKDVIVYTVVWCTFLMNP